MIEKILVLNLPEKQDRYWFAKGHLVALGAPLWCIEMHPAIKATDFRDMDEMQSKAVEAGFPFLKDEWYVQRDERGQLAMVWNWCEMLRTVIESDSTSLIMLDDRALTISFFELCGLVWWLCQKEQPFHALQLQSLLFNFGTPDEPIAYMPDCGHDFAFINEGFRGNGDYATVFSPAGARRFLDVIAERPFCGPERLFYEQSKPHDKTGFYNHAQGVVRDCGFIFGSDLKHLLDMQ